MAAVIHPLRGPCSLASLMDAGGVNILSLCSHGVRGPLSFHVSFPAPDPRSRPAWVRFRAAFLFEGEL